MLFMAGACPANARTHAILKWN